MNLEMIEKLDQLGFRPSRNGNNEHSSSWCQSIRIGSMKAVFCVREFGVGYQYRVLLASATKDREQEQWFDAVDIMSAALCLFAAKVLWGWTRRELEGPLVRRSWLKLISWWPPMEGLAASRNGTENGHREMQPEIRKEMN